MPSRTSLDDAWDRMTWRKSSIARLQSLPLTTCEYTSVKSRLLLHATLWLYKYKLRMQTGRGPEAFEPSWFQSTSDTSLPLSLVSECLLQRDPSNNGDICLELLLRQEDSELRPTWATLTSLMLVHTAELLRFGLSGSIVMLNTGPCCLGDERILLYNK